jgi:tRNA 2-selenouridine synthase
MRISAHELFDAMQRRVLLDVRTPAEYANGHIPGALSLPLFSNEERAAVGTLYKQQSPEAAFLKGLEYAGAKLRHYVEEAARLAPDRRVVLHCWRGGQRSGSMGWLLGSAGFDVLTLIGGYKAYRQMAQQELAQTQRPLVILGGPTGSGKTRVLAALQRAGETVVDLEGLARHKGSSFGALGEAPQPSVEQFENILHDAWRRLPLRGRVWLEDESRSIGRVYLPDPFWRLMLAAPIVMLEMPLAWRIQNLVEDYAHFPRPELEAAFQRIAKRLGGQHVQAALQALANDDYASAAAIALRYYDKAYQHTLLRRQPESIIRLEVEDRQPERIAQQLMALIDAAVQR